MSRARLSRSQYRMRVPHSFNGVRAAAPVQDAEIVDAIGATNSVVLTLDRPVLVAGVPSITAMPGSIAATSATLTGPLELTIGFGVSTATVTSLVLKQYDPAVRTSGGGWLRNGPRAVEQP